jgi:hypothetical protein
MLYVTTETPIFITVQIVYKYAIVLVIKFVAKSTIFTEFNYAIRQKKKKIYLQRNNIERVQ